MIQKATPLRWIRLKNIASAHALFVIIALAAGIAFIKLTPPLWGIDELTHFARVYQLSQGKLKEDYIHGQYGGSLPVNIIKLNSTVYRDLIDNTTSPNTHGQIDDTKIYSDIESQKPSAQKNTYLFPGSGIYSPIAYAAPALGSFSARILNLNIGGFIFMARLYTLLLYIFLVTLSLRLLNDSKAKWLVFTVALMPMSLYQASIVNVDSLAIGLSILLFALIYRAWVAGNDVTKKQFLLIFAIAGLISLAKPNYWLLAMPALLVGTRKTERLFTFPAKLILAAITAIPFLLWNLSVSEVAKAGLSMQVNNSYKVESVKQLVYVLTHPIHFIGSILSGEIHNSWFNQMVGFLGWNYVALPAFLICFIFMTVFAAAIYKDELNRKLNRGVPLAILIAGLLTSLSIFTIFYLSYTPLKSSVINGVQGRYFIPVLPFLLFGLARILPFKLTMTERNATIFFPTVMLFGLVASIGIYYSVTY